MKLEGFKQLIKESVREVFKEEFKEILLEALKSNNQQTITENIFTPHPTSKKTKIVETKTLTPKERHEMFGNILGEMKEGKTITTEQFIPKSIESSINGELPAGEVSLDQIANLMKK